MQMTPDEYADYIADGTRYQRGQHRWQAVRDRAKTVISDILANKSETEVAHALRDHGNKIDQLLQALKDATKCGRCRGKGSVETALGPDECPECQGTGVKP